MTAGKQQVDRTVVQPAAGVISDVYIGVHAQCVSVVRREQALR